MNRDSASKTTHITDPDLIRRAQQGDPDAFATLFQTHKARVYSLCLRMTNNVAEAEDLAQDAFLQVFRKLSSFRGDSALSTWLYRIAVNTVLMHFRRKSPCQISLDEPYTNHNEDSKQVSREYGITDDRLAGCVSRLALTRAISDLPQGCRTIFLLHEVEGYEHREIAGMLGCSVGNSKSQLHKAKLRIREFLASPRAARVEAAGKERAKTARTRVRTNVRPVPVVEPDAAETWHIAVPTASAITVLPFAQTQAA